MRHIVSLFFVTALLNGCTSSTPQGETKISIPKSNGTSGRVQCAPESECAKPSAHQEKPVGWREVQVRLP